MFAMLHSFGLLIIVFVSTANTKGSLEKCGKCLKIKERGSVESHIRHEYLGLSYVLDSSKSFAMYLMSKHPAGWVKARRLWPGHTHALAAHGMRISRVSMSSSSTSRSQKRLAVIGGMGTMLSPSSRHLMAEGSPAVVSVAHARPSARMDRIQAWQDHGAQIVEDLDAVLDADVEALLLCVGKNADDLPIVIKACKKWANTGRSIIHLSTVSPAFARAAASFCRSHNVRYGNYPLTGGPAGAEKATMLILASGDRSLYEEYLPVLQTIGNPRYFNEDDGRGAEVKLQGQMMVFGGLLGISSSAASSFAAADLPVTQSDDISDFLDFLNGGAGSTKQWDVALSRGLRFGDWSEGFQVDHAAVDALYAADMARNYGLSKVVQNQLLMIAASLAFLVSRARGGRLATHAIAKELRDAASLDDYLAPLWPVMADPDAAADIVLELLPESTQKRVLLKVGNADFK